MRREAHMELSYFSQFRQRTVAEFLARVLPNENTATFSSSLRASRASVQILSELVEISEDQW